MISLAAQPCILTKWLGLVCQSLMTKLKYLDERIVEPGRY